MASVAIETLFEQSRYPSGWRFATFLLYSPVGLILAVLRLFIGIHVFLVSCLLPKISTARSIILRIMCAVLGIIVTQKYSHNRSTSTKVIICNHITPLDHLAIDLVIANILPSVWDLPELLNWALGYRDLGVRNGRETLLRNVKKHCSESEVPILSYPEGASTSGKKGLLKFSTWPFSLDLPVQPILITTYRPPFVDVATSPIGSRWWTDLAWFAFVPYTHFQLRILPVQQKGSDETVEDFTARIQTLMATELNVTPTKYSSADKVEFVKRHLVSTGHRTSQHSSKKKQSFPIYSEEIRQMSKQVKEVLPQVPQETILKDLAKTNSVDDTITNLIEGRVNYEALTQPEETPAVVKRDKNASSAWATSPERRMKSYKERKAEMIEKARRAYIEKHGML